MIYITGDTHGDIDFQKLKDYFSGRYFTEKDYLIILGDAGIIWGENVNYIYEYERLGVTVFFIDGNHENFDLLSRFPVVNKCGAKAHYISKNIYHVMRGEILSLNGLSFLCLGGATSIDKMYRIPGISYWKDENIKDEDIENALQNLERHNNKVDYVLTHCCSSLCLKEHFGYRCDNDTDKLNVIEHVAKFKWWYFGHYHEDATLDDHHRVFYNDILEVDAPYKGKPNVKGHCYQTGKDGFLYSEKYRKTKLKEEDLPEWFYHGYNGYYYDLKGLVDVAFHPSYFSNHIDKDSYFALSYDKRIKRNRDGSVKHRSFDKGCDYVYSTWRVSIEHFIEGVNRYSPNIKFDKIKRMVNRVCDNYYNDLVAYFPNDGNLRYYPEYAIPHDPERPFVLYRNGVVQCEFESFNVAKRFALQLGEHIGKDCVIEENGHCIKITYPSKAEVVELQEIANKS